MIVASVSAGSLLAGRREPPLIPIGSIRPYMAFSNVRVRGLLEDRPRLLPDGTALLLIADTSGSLPVFIDRTVPDRLPESGAWVSVEGCVRMASGSGMSMNARSPARIEVLDAPAPVRVQGRVREVHSPPKDSRAPYRFVLDRPEGRLEVVHWFEPAITAVVGDRLVAEGVLGFYRGRKQVKVRSADDIRLAIRDEHDTANRYE